MAQRSLRLGPGAGQEDLQVLFDSEQVSSIWHTDNDFSLPEQPLKSKNFISNFQTLQSNGNYIGQFTGPFVEFPFSQQILYPVNCGSRLGFICVSG